MTFRRSALSDLELRYPFAPGSRRFFETIPIEEGLASKEVTAQTVSRLLAPLGRAKYEPHPAGLVEFSSFFAAALVACQDGYLASKFAKREGESAREYFIQERSADKVVIFSECFGVSITEGKGADGRPWYSMDFVAYLELMSRYQLGKSPTWKLVRQALDRGVVQLSDNLLNDLFGSCAQAAVAEGVRRLRRGAFPKALTGARDQVMGFVPAPRPRSERKYGYVEDLLKHPTTDGRHRLVWLVLAPYMVNVKNLESEEAVERIRAFVAVGGETQEMKRFIEYNVRRAKRNGLVPPTLTTMKREHPDVYSLMPKEVLASEPRALSTGRK